MTDKFADSGGQTTQNPREWNLFLLLAVDYSFFNNQSAPCLTLEERSDILYMSGGT